MMDGIIIHLASHPSYDEDGRITRESWALRLGWWKNGCSPNSSRYKVGAPTIYLVGG